MSCINGERLKRNFGLNHLWRGWPPRMNPCAKRYVASTWFFSQTSPHFNKTQHNEMHSMVGLWSGERIAACTGEWGALMNAEVRQRHSCGKLVLASVEQLKCKLLLQTSCPANDIYGNEMQRCGFSFLSLWSAQFSTFFIGQRPAQGIFGFSFLVAAPPSPTYVLQQVISQRSWAQLSAQNTSLLLYHTP